MPRLRGVAKVYDAWASTHAAEVLVRFEFTKTLSENFSMNLEQRRISPRMGLPITTILEGDAPHEQDYHN